MDGVIFSVVFTGLLFFIIGFIMLKYKVAYLLAGYQAGKYDDDKLCQICGSHLIFLGFFVTSYGSLIFFFPEQVITHTIVLTAVTFSTFIRMIYRVNKYAKK